MHAKAQVVLGSLRESRMRIYSSRLWEKYVVCVSTTNLSSEMFKIPTLRKCSHGAAGSGGG